MFIKGDTFFNLLKKGVVTEDDYEDFAEQWHRGVAPGIELCDYLGMGWPIFSKFAEQGHSYLRRFYGIDRSRKVAGKKEK